METSLQVRQAREDRVLREARALISERGADGVTIRELAQRSGVSVPTLYSWFGDKSALLVRAVERTFEAFLDETGSAASSPAEALLELPRAAADAMLGAPDYSRSVIEVFAQAGAENGMMDAVAGAVAVRIGRFLEELEAAGGLETWVAIAPLAERLASLHVVTCMQWAGGRIPDAAFGATLQYGMAITTLGSARGDARERIAACAERAQRTLLEAGEVPRRAPAGGRRG